MKTIILILLIPVIGHAQYYLTGNVSNKSVSVDLGVIHTTWGMAIGYNAFMRPYSTIKSANHFLDVSPIFTPSLQNKNYGIYFPTGYNFYGTEIRTRYGFVGWNNWVGIKIGFSLKIKI